MDAPITDHPEGTGMYEVEQKARIAHEDVREAIAGADARFGGTVEQRDSYFDHPARAFAATDEALRIRRERVVTGDIDASDRITYKGPRLATATKTRVERESRIADPDELVAILEAMDFSIAGVVEKTRERYLTDECEICLDTVDGLGEFVEIEVRQPAEDLEAAKATTAEVGEWLGLGAAERVPESYLAMVLREAESS